MPTLETSVDVLLLTPVTESPSRIQHAPSVRQSLVNMPPDTHTVVVISLLRQHRCTTLICDDNQHVNIRWRMMHLTTGGVQVRSEESNEAHLIGSVPYNITPIETWAVECVIYKNFSGWRDMAKVICIFCAGIATHVHQTRDDHIRAASSCTVCFAHIYVHMLLDAVIQHCI